MSLRDRAIQAEREARNYWIDVVEDERGNYEIPWKDRLDAALRAGLTPEEVRLHCCMAPHTFQRWLAGYHTPTPGLQDKIQQKLYEELQKRRT